MINTCTGFGARDTHARTLNDGRPNPHPSAGQPYATVDPSTIYAMVASPPTVAKEDGQWIIPSSYAEYDARSHDAQREFGSYHWLTADIDEGNPPLEQVRHAIGAALGDVYAVVYSTAGATPSNRKWRVLVPLATPLPGAQYSAYQAALFDGLERCGLVLDRTLERPGQLVYLPNRGAHYEFAYMGTAHLDAPQHPMAARARMYMDMAATVAKGSGQERKEGARSHLAAFRRKHSIPELLEAYGYTRKGGSDHWRSPYQTSGSYATQDLGDGWFSLSASDAQAGLGRPAPNGRYGDQFDLYVHFTCGGDYTLAEGYARQCLKDEDAARYGDATVEHGREVWQAISRASAEAAMARATVAMERMALDSREGNNAEWSIGWPPGLVGELAQWIYASSSRPVKQYAIAAALYFFSVAGRKFNVDGKGLNLYLMLVGGTGRGKGVVKTAVDRVVDAIVNKSQDPNLGAPYSYEVAVSEAGIRKGLAKQNPMCTYEEELGLTLLPLTSSKASTNDIGLRKVLTRLFDSGEGSKLGIKQASSQENTKDMVYMPCLTLAGDTQPHVFRALLGNGMLDTGFAPRMVPFFYYGKRSYHNEASDAHQTPPEGLITALSAVLEYCIRTSEAVVKVRWDEAVRADYNKLDVEYTDKINSGEVGAEMFNRAGVIVARVAALLAVGVNHIDPVIDRTCYDYAKAVIWQGLEESQRILASGGGGLGESVRLFHVREAIKDFLVLNPDTKMRTYKTPKAVVDSKHLINDRFFLVRFKSNTDFAPAGGYGTTEQNIREALDEAVRQEILEAATDVILDKRTTQKIYQIGPHF